MEQRQRRGIYLLPNLFTTAGLFAGFYAILVAMSGRFEAAAIAIFIAMIMDGLDGRVARMTNTMSAFGTEYDSLSDMVSFGLAPALVVYQWALAALASGGGAMAKLVWAATFIYTAGAALRLARFNTQVGNADKRYFQGLPSPAAAGLMAGLVWTGADLGYDGTHLWLPALLISVLAGLLMVSNARYHSFKDLDFRNRVPFVRIIAVVAVFVAIALDPPKVLFAVFLFYAVLGPVFTLVSLRKVRASRRSHGGPPGSP